MNLSPQLVVVLGFMQIFRTGQHTHQPLRIVDQDWQMLRANVQRRVLIGQGKQRYNIAGLLAHKAMRSNGFGRR
jgi:hypothetical protein